MTATYSPEDNKLRLYSVSRLAPELYARVREAGFIYAPKQQLFVAPMWTPNRADLLIELCGEIDDEDGTLVARAEERSERFSEYSEHRAADADRAQKAVAAIADGIPFGQPILIGHHSERHARRDAQKIEDGMRRAVKMWDTATYWTDRAAGAIRNAKHKERPDVRARRIKTLEADQRKQERIIAESTKYQKAWGREGMNDVRARLIANYDRLSFNFPAATYPASTYEGPRSLWSALDSGVIDAAQAADLALPAHHRIIAHASRWVAHISNRLAYERAMLAEDGGTLADQNKPEKGGACRCWPSPRGGWSYIQKVNRVTVSVLHNYSEGGTAFSITVPFDKLTGIMSAAAVEQKRSAGLLIESAKGIGFYLAPTPSSPPPTEEPTEAVQVEEATEIAVEPEQTDPETALRALWTEQGVSQERQDKLIAGVTEAARPGAQVGPFQLSTQTNGDATSSTAQQIEAMRQTLRSGGVTVVSAPQLFPTPAMLAARMIELADIEPCQEVLEPSAGTGVLCDAIQAAQPTARIFAVEINHQLCELLSQKITAADDAEHRISRNVLQGDFLECDGLGTFARIVMNPPFADGADIQHITHALRLLNPGGRIVALCANGPRQNAKLRPIIEEMGGDWEELPAGTFAAAGTGVRTVLLSASLPA